jgi:hypothetical protein
VVAEELLAEELSLPAADAPRVWERVAEDDESAESLLSAKAVGMSATP